MGNDLLLDVDRTIDKTDTLQAPSVNATGPNMAARSSHHHWSQIGLAADTETTQASGIQQRKEERQIDGQQCNLIWRCCTALRWAALANSYPLATLRTSSTRRLGTQENRDCALAVNSLYALQPDEGHSPPLTRIRPPNYTVPPPSMDAKFPQSFPQHSQGCSSKGLRNLISFSVNCRYFPSQPKGDRAAHQ